jgi:ATP-GRASP peptide maturase of grasp-with-spasm system
MVLIFSIEFEISTNEVIHWLQNSNITYKRVNEDITNLGSLLVLDGNGEKEHIIDGINLRDIQSVWYRRGGKMNLEKWFNLNSLSQEIFHHLKEELLTTKYAYFNSIFKNKKALNSPFNSHLNKIHILEEAINLGIKIPYTIVCTSKNLLIDLFKAFPKRYIVKPVNKVKDLKLQEGTYFQLTEEVYLENIEKLEDSVFPCIIQEYIPKSFEIRTFYLNEKFYSMAMFSQSNPNTTLDFRNYDYDNPNRRVPFKLETDYEDKLKSLLKKINLNCASIDILRGTDGNFYFLEINPVGQFGMVSYPCNYFLEREIADFLKK